MNYYFRILATLTKAREREKNFHLPKPEIYIFKPFLTLAICRSKDLVVGVGGADAGEGVGVGVGVGGSGGGAR